MPRFDTGMSRAFAKSGPSGNTIVKSTVLTNCPAPIRNTSLRSDIAARMGKLAPVLDHDRLADRLHRGEHDVGVWMSDGEADVAVVVRDGRCAELGQPGLDDERAEQLADPLDADDPLDLATTEPAEVRATH